MIKTILTLTLILFTLGCTSQPTCPEIPVITINNQTNYTEYINTTTYIQNQTNFTITEYINTTDNLHLIKQIQRCEYRLKQYNLTNCTEDYANLTTELKSLKSELYDCNSTYHELAEVCWIR